MPKKYRRILAGTAAIGVVAAILLWRLCYHPTMYSCIAGALATVGSCAANLLWRAYLRHEMKKQRERQNCMEHQPTNLISGIRK